ncbi:MAG: PAS domain-containing protein, partial [Paraglaciecola polaris]
MSKVMSSNAEREVAVGVGQELVSTTDTQGIIQYVNDHFCRVSGYSREELIGQHHNIVRHPDMPKAAFADMWSKLKSKQAWRGAVKNRCNGGGYYWVDAFVT